MPFTLNPDPSTLGIAAPYLGRWFTSSMTLPAPTAGSTLGLSINLQGNDWRPPATGVLSLFVADATTPPAPLAPLRDTKGKHPFTTGQIVALFTLLPEVQARLRDLLRQIPALVSSTAQPPADNPTRLAARTFALGLPLTSTNLSGLFALFPDIPSSVSSDADKATYLGLELSTATLVNGKRPMTQLRRPGAFALPGGVIPAQEDVILSNVSGSCTLWTFDARGRAIDPGAVAAWFSYLVAQSQSTSGGNTTSNALAFGGTDNWPAASGGDKRVCLYDDARTIHFTDAHEGVLLAPFVGSGGRLQLAGSAPTDTVVLATGNGTSLSFTAAPTTPPGNPAFNPAVDNAPQPRMAVLPDGTYGSTLSLWPNGAVATALSRDFTRVAVVDIERHLVGVERADSGSVPTDPTARRGADQNRPSTRTSVAACTGTGDVLLTTAEQAAALMLEAFSPGTSGRLVVGVADGQAGSLPSPLTDPGGAPPVEPPNNLTEDSSTTPADNTYRVLPLVGCHLPGSTPGNAASQQVLLEIKVGTTLKGAWFRAWPLGFDFDRGEHFRLDGGAGVVADDGVARIVMLLPDTFTASTPGFVTAPTAIPSFDLMLLIQRGQPAAAGVVPPVTTLRRREYGDRRYHRPDPVDGSLVDTIDATMTWFVCETGQHGTGAPNGVVSPGATLLVKKADGTSTLATRSKIPAAALQTGTLMRALSNGGVITLTQPAFKSTVDKIDDRGLPVPSNGDGATTPGNIAPPGSTGVTIDRTARPGQHGSRLPPSVPFPSQERLEVAAWWTEASDVRAAVGAANLVSRAHEILPADAGHPGSPGGEETHGTGVRLQGPAAVLAAEYVLDRTAGITGSRPISGIDDIWIRSEPALALEASKTTFSPQAATGSNPWAAVLKTNAVAMEGLPGAAQAASALNAYPLSTVPNQLTTWLNNVGSGLGAGNIGTQLQNQLGTKLDTMFRALDRRLKTSLEGAHEAALSLDAALQRAQDFVYIETTAFDNHGPTTTDQLSIFNRLSQALTSNPGLQAIICVAAQPPTGFPKGYGEIRDDEIVRAKRALQAAASGRVAVFAPGAGAGRSVRFASTTVIIDDAYALTGTTHLSRRGLTFDSSLAVAVFDEHIVDGRPREVRQFRRRLLGGRLGVPEALIPDDPAELVRAIRDFDRTGSFRLAFHDIRSPENAPIDGVYPTDTDRAAWNPDGSVPGLTFALILAQLQAAHRSGSDNINDPL